jgi:hypothetical protein
LAGRLKWKLPKAHPKLLANEDNPKKSIPGCICKIEVDGFVQAGVVVEQQRAARLIKSNVFAFLGKPGRLFAG